MSRFLTKRINKVMKWFDKTALNLFDDNVRILRIRLRTMKDQYKGQRCFLMGNGPSLNQMDLSLFKDEFVWGSNKCYLLFDRIDWRPKFYVGVDTRVIPDICREIEELEKTLPATKFFFPLHFRQDHILQSRSNVFWYHSKWMDQTNLPFGVFSPDAANWVSSVTTVTIAMMQLAVYLGFNPIYLIGCDTSYVIPKTVQRENGEDFRLVSTQDDDPNHFSAQYFGTGSKWHDPHPEYMIEHYEQSKIACDLLGVQVYNATVGGKLEVFPRVDYTSLF